MKEHVNEKDLIKSVASGDRKAFNVLYCFYLNDLYRYVYLFLRSKEASEEIIQDVFVRVWQRREYLIEVNSFKAYTYRIAKNLLLDEIRKRQIEQRVLVMLRPENEESCEKSDERLIYKQYYQLAQNAINLLPEKRRQIVEMRTKEGLSLDEIAERLSISKNVVKKQLYAGLSFIRNHLREYVEFSGTLLLFLSLFNN